MPEDGNRASFRNVLFVKKNLDDEQSPKRKGIVSVSDTALPQPYSLGLDFLTF